MSQSQDAGLTHTHKQRAAMALLRNDFFVCLFVCLFVCRVICLLLFLLLLFNFQIQLCSTSSGCISVRRLSFATIAYLLLFSFLFFYFFPMRSRLSTHTYAQVFSSSSSSSSSLAILIVVLGQHLSNVLSEMLPLSTHATSCLLTQSTHVLS